MAESPDKTEEEDKHLGEDQEDREDNGDGNQDCVAIEMQCKLYDIV